MVDWDILLAASFGTPLQTLCARPELVRRKPFWRLYRTAPTQYLSINEDPANGQLKFRGFAWVASDGAASIIFLRQGGAAIGRCDLPPPLLLPKAGVFSADAIADHGSQTEPDTLTRYVNLTHQVSFGAFRYHYELITPRPTDTPIAIEVDRDPDIHTCLA